MRRRPVGFLHTAETRLKTLFTPSDWAIVTLLGIVLSGSAAIILANVSLATSVEVPAQGGVFREGLVGNPRFVNPLLAISETDRDLVQLIYSGLMKQEPDGTLSADLAESYTLSEDKLTYTFTLKEGAVFHDGEPVKVGDVAFTVRGAQNPDMKSPRRANWEGVVVTVIDEKTIAFTLSKPYAPFLENATMGILPEHAWEGLSTEEFQFSKRNAEPIGSGPYRIDYVKRNDSGIPTEYALRAFSEGVRVPYIERMVFTFYANIEALKEALDSGKVDAAHSIHPDDTQKELTVAEAPYGRVFAVFFNQNQNGLFTDATVRNVLDRAVDKEEIVSTILSGYGSPLSGPLPLQGNETRPAEASAATRIESARQLLLDDGWKLGEDGILEKTVKKETKRLSFSLSTASAPELKRAAEMVAEDWTALGAEVDLKFFEQNDLNVEVLRPRKYDALLFGLVTSREHDLFAFWHSSQRNDPGLNIALYANKDVDRLLDAARQENDHEAREAFIREATEAIMSDNAAVFLYAPHFVYLVPPTIMGIKLDTITNASDRFSSVEDWYLGSEMVWPFFE